MISGIRSGSINVIAALGLTVAGMAIAGTMTANAGGGAPQCHGEPPTPGYNFGDGDDDIKGTGAPEVIVAGGGDDQVNGGGGDDLICGGSGNDSMGGNDDDDYILGGQGRDSIGGQLGRDVVKGGAGQEEGLAPFRGDPENLLAHVTGGENADRVFGGGGDDLVEGNEGPDRLAGQAGTDLCIGGPGRDKRRSCE